ncbi:DNA-dependent metalloprotease dvc-1 isoform X2 [Cloeon dipterum]|uniref:DNA-dependent metalloprotease dvc-1 isoform X2 n=1 Tax=Cloeon dipterum TaxID=197152 RepID=UPI0032206C8D
MSSSSIVSQEWELVDPCPDIHALFIEYNKKYFWGKLDGVALKWSPRMTLCAGLCRYEGRGGLCSISLSAPLLKLRPRKDLVETLLHEMIHAYLFVTANNRDRDGHGPEFQKHMYRINNLCGCNITIYHSFHAEVKLYQQHVWRCLGVCRERKPFFGFVRRSMNRAPSHTDTWWSMHERSCGGKFVKIQEPEEFTKKKQAEADRKAKRENKNKVSKAGDIRPYLSPTKNSNGRSSGPKASTSAVNGKGRGDIRNYGNPVKGPAASTNNTNKVTKPVSGSGIGASSNISGFSDAGRGGRRGMGGTATANRGGGTLVVSGRGSQERPMEESQPSTSFVPFIGKGHTVGSASGSTGNAVLDRQKFLARFNQPEQKPLKKQKTEIEEKPGKLHCPICEKPCPAAEMNDHIEQCLRTFNFEDDDKKKQPPEEVIVLSDDEEDESNMEQCPLCSAYYPADLLKSHIDNCVQHLHDSFQEDTEESQMVHCPICNEKIENDSLQSHTDSCVQSLDGSFDGEVQEVVSDTVKCPICDVKVEREMINEHLDYCAGY